MSEIVLLHHSLIFLASMFTLFENFLLLDKKTFKNLLLNKREKLCQIFEENGIIRNRNGSSDEK